MQARLRRAATLLIVAASIAAAAVSASAGTVERPRQAGELRAQNEALAESSRSAVLELFALDMRLARSRAELASIRERIAVVAAERATLRRRLSIAERTLAASERMLAERLLALYQQEQAEPLAILLGARSLDEAMAGLDGLSAVATQDARIVRQVSTARRDALEASGRLRGQAATLRTLEAAAEARTLELGRERTQRARYLSQLAAERQVNTARIAALARAAHERAERLSRRLPSPSALPHATEVGGSGPTKPQPAVGARTLTVVATGYAIAGRTATGIRAGPGVVSVDPAVIPLGTRMTIPGYGDGIAADVGSAVRGARIDLWFATTAQAFAWGERAVTIVLR